MPGESHGEYIDLAWDGGAEYYAVRGHVSDEEAFAAVMASYDNDVVVRPVARQLWAHWGQTEWAEWDCTLMLHWASGRGRFEVTVVWPERTWLAMLDTHTREFEMEVARG